MIGLIVSPHLSDFPWVLRHEEADRLLNHISEQTGALCDVLSGFCFTAISVASKKGHQGGLINSFASPEC